MPSAPILEMASEAKRTTSPWVTSATVGIFLDTLGDFSWVFWTSEMRRFRPSPVILVSNFPLNLPNSSMPMNDAKFSLVNAFEGSNPSQSSCCSHHVTASNVTLRKILPLDQHTTRFLSSFSNFSFSLATVVPLPVPESPQSTTTPPPPLPPSPSPPFLTVPKISSATSSGLFPKTSTSIYSSGTNCGSNTPFSFAISIPFCNFDASSSSRWRMPSPSDFARDRNSEEVE
mmetsp:Transcript_15093/g.27269  ORF Transcript_15093/g.27269 Transcript_15093/m.27269 type:complete len:230 (+) Transcript_15093:511-1200(+)